MKLRCIIGRRNGRGKGILSGKSALLKRATCLALGLAGLAMTADHVAPVRADGAKHEIKVSMNQLPAAVAKTLTIHTAGGTIDDIEISIHANIPVYEADAVINKLPYEITVAINGTLLEKHLGDLNLTIAQLPVPVRATLKQEMGDGTAAKMEEDFFDNGSPYYKAEIRVGKRLYMIRILPGGALLKVKLKQGKEGEHQGEHLSCPGREHVRK